MDLIVDFLLEPTNTDMGMRKIYKIKMTLYFSLNGKLIMKNIFKDILFIIDFRIKMVFVGPKENCTFILFLTRKEFCPRNDRTVSVVDHCISDENISRYDPTVFIYFFNDLF